ALGSGAPAAGTARILSRRDRSASVGWRVRAARKMWSRISASDAFEAAAFATAPLSERSRALIVGPVARGRACDIDGSEDRSQEQVLRRSGRPNESRNALGTLLSGSCRLLQPDGKPGKLVGTPDTREIASSRTSAGSRFAG